MGVFKKLIFVVALVISVVSGITLSSSVVEARWVFDASPPTTVITQPISEDSITTLTATITDNKTLSITTTKQFYFLINDSALPSIPGTTTSPNLYPSSCPSRITSENTPCLVNAGVPGIRAGVGSTLIAEQSNVEFSANSPTYYIYGKLLQDEVGNSGEWSTAKTFSPTASKEDPFLQTTEGDVHSNKNIDTRKKP